MLELVAKMEDIPIADYEAQLDQIRARRLSALFEYQTTKFKELDIQGNKVSAQLKKQHEMLGKELVRLDELITKCETRINKMSALRDELGLVDELKGALGQ